MQARFFTDVGPTRERNEDAGGVYYNHTNQMLLVICDGMGGHNSGDVASDFVNNMMKERFEDENYIEPEQAEGWLRSNISDINRQLYTKAHLNDVNYGMGTTLVCAILYEKKVVIANVGDSRCYIVNESELRQVTNDHTFVNHLVMAGELTKEEARNHPQRNVITKVIGSDKRIHPDLFEIEYQRFDYLLLSSDGLTDYVDEDVIHRMFSQYDSPLEIGEALIETAISNNARDNVSLIIVPLKGGI